MLFDLLVRPLVGGAGFMAGNLVGNTVALKVPGHAGLALGIAASLGLGYALRGQTGVLKDVGRGLSIQAGVNALTYGLATLKPKAEVV